MAVYVDDMFAEFNNMLMCHLVADTHEELIDMVGKIGVNKKWIQYPGTYREHFDIAKGKRELAIRNGAIPITWRQCGIRESYIKRGEKWTPGTDKDE